jgi:hypothetical protein
MPLYVRNVRSLQGVLGKVNELELPLKEGSELAQRTSVQLSENASAEVLNGRPSRWRAHDLPRACWPFTESRVPSAGTSTVQTP